MSESPLRNVIETIKNILFELKLHKTGLIGLIILIFYTFVAIFAPYIAPADPNKMGLADSYAYPEWFALFPQVSESPTEYNTKFKLF